MNLASTQHTAGSVDLQAAPVATFLWQPVQSAGASRASDCCFGARRVRISLRVGGTGSSTEGGAGVSCSAVAS